MFLCSVCSFLAHPISQAILADLWMGGLRMRKNPVFKIIIGLFFPPSIAKLEFKTREELELMPQTEEELHVRLQYLSKTFNIFPNRAQSSLEFQVPTTNTHKLHGAKVEPTFCHLKMDEFESLPSFILVECAYPSPRRLFNCKLYLQFQAELQRAMLQLWFSGSTFPELLTAFGSQHNTRSIWSNTHMLFLRIFILFSICVRG